MRDKGHNRGGKPLRGRSVLFRLWAGGLVLALLLAAGVALAQSSYPKRADTYINDYANLLTTDTAARIRGWLMDLKRSRDIDMTVLTINRLSDYDSRNPTIESFATGLFNTWGIGNGMTNRGILLLVSRDDRKLRLEIGSGYDRYIYNRKAQKVIDVYILPAFRQDNYDTGIEKGVRATIFEFTGGWPTGGAPTFFERLDDAIREACWTAPLIRWVCFA
jgi:uncharacterized protein